MKKEVIILLMVLVVMISFPAVSQVSINTDGTDPDASAMLDVKSTEGGMLIPRMTQTERDNINGGVFETGLLIYQTDNTPGFYYYDGSAWQSIVGGDDGDWTVNSNYVYNLNESVGIGTQTPANKLDVAGGIVIGSNIAGSEVAPPNGLLVEGRSVFGDGVYGESTSNYGVFGSSPAGGVRGENESDFYGILAGELSGTVTALYGVYGSGQAESYGMLGATVDGLNYGVYGNGDRAGVFGEHVGSGPGVRGKSVNGDGVSGESTNGYGIVGSGPAGGVKGQNGFIHGILAGELSGIVTASYGVYGSNKDGNYGMLGAEVNGFSSGVYGNGDYAGVFGEHGGGGPGVLGKSSSGYGVYGESTDNTGVAGYGRYVGIYGQASEGHAGYFEGDVYIEDNLGIGTSSPSTKLDVNGTITANAFIGDGSGLTGILSNNYWQMSGNNIYNENTGNVGIGTSNPLTNLEVSHPEDAWLRISADNNNSGGDDGTQNAYLQFTTDEGSEDFDGLIWLENLSGDTKLHFDVENQETMVMHNGEVGIGTESPDYKLDVRGNRIQIKEDVTGDWMAMRTDGAGLDIQFEGGNCYFQSTTDGEHILLNPNRNSYVGFGTSQPTSALCNSSALSSDGTKSTSSDGINWRINGGGYALGIENTATGGSGLLVDAGNNAGTGSTVAHFVSNNVSLMHIGEDGKVGIGTTIPNQLLSVDNGSTIGTYTTSGWQHSSDARLKTNISQIDNALEKVMDMEGVYFDWKDKEEKHQVGVIAQDMEKVLPEVVNQDDEGFYSVSYGGVVPVLIEAIKEQQKEIEELKEIISKLDK